ncbi:MAG: L-seryl-tRNA(Sec) selenium transferase [Dehalococcoidales bacterium]|jgi:L-seryl-tRNA(Ser) seleniumtransferase|nr:L-seryl-tRNA(Sec) selenium transferase [Dehalococcoidales bacterium]MDP6632450.1 L-seryl-tRNA(Sec) selenium transferase [Dehalococcoidales bacterium]
MDSEFRRLPSVDKVISVERIQQLAGEFPRELLVSLVRQQLEQERLAIVAGNKCSSIDQIVTSVSEQLGRLETPSLRPVVNATGVILHTNLGRAPLSREAIAAMETVSKDYSNLEFDIDGGIRGTRHVHIEQILCQLSGAEAALVVNNNASAVLLGLSALARRKEVIVSRGEAVEIGGSFRIPDVMRQSGSKLIEVGTTNCTYIADYEEAITPRTAALMRVHSSNFKVVGFTQAVDIEGLAELGRRNDLTVFDDLGSGCFLDATVYGLAPEPMVQQSVAAGVGLICFSGDKMVGGPQAGIMVGKKKLIDKLKKHPLARAVRIDKIRLAGLAATLLHYLKGEATGKIPIWRMISASVEEIAQRAEVWAEASGGSSQVVDGESMVGGGSLPGSTLPTRLVAIGEGKVKGKALAQMLARELRRNESFPVIGRISDDVLLLDPRSVLPEEDKIMIQALKGLVAESKSG